MPRPSATAFSTALLPKLSQCMADDGPRNITKSLWLSLSTSVEDAASRERSLLASWGSDKPSVPASHRLAGLEWMDPDRDGAPNPRHRSPFVGTTSSWRRPRVRPSVRPSCISGNWTSPCRQQARLTLKQETWWWRRHKSLSVDRNTFLSFKSPPDTTHTPTAIHLTGYTASTLMQGTDKKKKKLWYINNFIYRPIHTHLPDVEAAIFKCIQIRLDASYFCLIFIYNQIVSDTIPEV